MVILIIHNFFKKLKGLFIIIFLTQRYLHVKICVNVNTSFIDK